MADTLPANQAAIPEAASLAMGMAEIAGANSIAIVMYNAAQAQQAVQQVEVAALGFVIAKMAAASASQ